MNRADKQYLTPTAIIDSDHRTVIAYAMETIGGSKDVIRSRFFCWLTI